MTSPIEITRFEGLKSGPALLVFGAIHGQEICGSKAIHRAMQAIRDGQLGLARGSVTFVPVANPRAYQKRVRYTDENLNRVFQLTRRPNSYEAHLANILCPLVEACDVLLDLHSTTADGQPFIYLDYDTKANGALAAVLGPKVAIVGWPALYKKLGLADDAVCTTDYAARFGKDAVVVECGQHQSPHAEDVAYHALLNTMRHYGLITGRTTLQRIKMVRMTHGYFREHAKDRLAKTWKHLDPIKKGAPLIHHVDGRVTKAPRDAVIIMPKANAAVGDDWLYLGSV